ncbi:MAG TPA: RNA polymerase sigma factor [Ktedonobacterales bacterium]
MASSVEPRREAHDFPGRCGHQQSPSERAGSTSALAHSSSSDIEREMTAARPRLLRLARARGLPLETAHEVAQETLLEAWRHLDSLSDPAGFQVWLNAICRHVCRRYSRAHKRLAQREVSLDTHSDADVQDDEYEAGMVPLFDIPDALALDPMEELERHDREILLDRALSHLAAPTREAIALCYLRELPQREVARRLGLTIAALEARLHRARRQLRQVLSGELRAEAEAFGLALVAGNETAAAVWRDTRMWCPACAQHRLRGAFEPLPSGKVNLHLRCPGCAHEVNSYGHVPLAGMRTFRPAYKRVIQYTHAYFLPGLASGRLACEACGSLQPLCLARADELLDAQTMQRDHRQRSGLLLVTQCQACRRHHAEIAVASLLWAQPLVQRFLGAHPRSITEPEALVEYQGTPAIHIRITAVSSAARLTLVVHPQTLRVLATSPR